MDKDIAIKVEHLSKTFRIPHEKVSSVRGAVVSAFKTGGYEEFKALDDVSFEVKKGEFFGIIGRNGSGKSTLLKILAGIYQPDYGKVHVNGMISPFLELGIGFNPELSGRDNIYLNATVLGMTKKQIDEKFDAIVAFSELERFIDQKLKNYSSGMQVRLAFAVSIHANRDILLMDEVLAVGDSNFQAKCLAEFVKYKEMGKTVVLVSHDVETIRRYCNRAMLVRYGNVRMIGNAEDVVQEYYSDNINDEIHRSVSDNKETTRQIDRKNPVNIKEVVFFDSKGQEKNVFETGDSFSVKVFFERSSPDIVNVNFGVAIFDQDGSYIFGINSIIDNIDTSKYIQEGFFQIDYHNVPLKTNAYYLKIGVFGESDHIVYDFLNKSRTIRFISRDRNQGLLDVAYKWG
jgi:ABC-type polysaccharide/polyol phosphate transport system ATPase subunit